VAMRTEIKELHQRLKTTTVYVTHDQIEAMTMADKIVVMHDGIVEQMGTSYITFFTTVNLIEFYNQLCTLVSWGIYRQCGIVLSFAVIL
ncbi:MAG TPA: hypothetical protein VNS32_26370, partial [Flavisolibacter sp.]|nr:hypothetical protein [Flavisolibacter sp.]